MGSPDCKMMLRIVVLLALCTAVHALPGVYGGNGGKKPSTCIAKYETMENSTMCFFGENSTVTEHGVSAEDRNAILDAHNNYRANVSPTAKNMLKMYWDEEIAVIAQHYADACPSWHDSNENRKVPGYGIGIGQNMAWGFRSWSLAIEGWHSEVAKFNYGGSNYVYDVGHYTQVVSFKDNRIGCGYAMCDWAIYVCNYGMGPAYINKPYKEGPSCSSCPETCENNLCDCGDLLCKNGGTLDVTTCGCSCAPNYKGTMCDELDCPASDGSSCSYYKKNGGIENCEKYANVPEQCPYMCGICTDSGSDSSSESSGESDSGSSDVDCPASDGSNCSWYKDNGGIKNCEKYANVPEECPYMCGICTGSGSSGESDSGSSDDCGDLLCMNGGTLNTPTCSCSCAPNYKGATCDELDCPASDDASCSWYKDNGGIELCDIYYNVPQDCPYMCGICTEAEVACEDELWYCYLSVKACAYAWYGGERSGERVQDTCKKTCGRC